MTTYLINQEETKDRVKGIGAFMFFCSAVQALMVFIDPFYIVDALLCAYLGYRAYKKPTKGLMMWISSYYAISIFVTAIEGLTSPHAYIIKIIVMLWMISVTSDTFKYLKGE